jgi:two-component system chemotaxis sensor kinase CheA
MSEKKININDLPTNISDLIKLKKFYVVMDSRWEKNLAAFINMVKDLGFHVHFIKESESTENYVKLYLHKIAVLIIDPGNSPVPNLNQDFDLSDMVETLLSMPLDEAAHCKANEFIRFITSEAGEQWFDKLREEQDMRATFLHHTEALIEDLEHLALDIEEQPDSKALINQLFNLVHTFKGASGFVRPKTLFEFTHQFEDSIKKVQNGEMKINSSVISLFLQAIDKIKKLSSDIRSDLYLTENLQQALALFEQAYMLEDEDAAAQLANGEGDKKQDIQDKIVEHKKQTEIKIGIGLLDRMLETTGEMTVIRNMLNKIVRSVERRFENDNEISLLSELLEELHGINESIQTQMTSLRQIEVKNILKPLGRVVRDTSNFCKKNVKLETIGNELRIDTTIGDILNSTLIHLVRNSVDHGIETPADREKKGKNAQGSLQVTVRNNRDHVMVEIRDDGKGIDPKVIRSKVIEKRLLPFEEVASLNDHEIIQYIFAPGFSTAEVVTDVSGRGVGMGAVKEAVESIGGNLILQSEVNKGTTTTMLLPIPKTAMIIDCLFVNCMGKNFGVPQEWIQRVVHVHPGNKKDVIRVVGGGQLFITELGLMPIVELSETLFNEVGLINNAPNFDVLIIQTNSYRPYAMAVDRVLDVEDTVVKKFEPLDRQLKVYSGATFVGDGTVGLIIDLEGIAERYHFQEQQRKFDIPIVTSSKDQSALAMANRFIVFNMSKVSETDNATTVYAIREKEIFRIEEVNCKQVQNSGEYPIIPYRDSFLHIVDLRMMNAASRNYFRTEFEKDSMSCIVVKYNKKQYVGLIVNEIFDIFESNATILSNLHEQKGVEGTFIYNDRIYTVIKVEELLADISDAEARFDLPEKNPDLEATA